MKAVVLFILVLAAVASAQLWSSKVTEELRQAFKTEKRPEILVVMQDEVSTGEFFRRFSNVEDRTNSLIIEKLAAKMSQKSIIEYLKAKKLSYKSFMVQNLIAVEDATREVVQWLSAHPSVRLVTIDYKLTHDDPISVSAVEASEPKYFYRGKEIAWHIPFTGADKVWDEGFTGKGMVAATIDTGVNAKHAILAKTFRGYSENGTVDTKFNWHDPSKACPKNTVCDKQGHGSHTTGIMSGQSDEHITGLAPDSKWVSCAGLYGNFMSSLIECFEFFLAPWGEDRDDVRPELRPHVVSNSYRCSDSIDRCSNIVKDLTKTLETAGVAVMFSAGNSGPSCNSLTKNMTSPLLVAALKQNAKTVTSFSSRGPMTLPDGTKLIKPDISAPGENVVSVAASTAKGVVKMSGTSMASPQVGGAIVLLWSAVPKLERNVEKTFDILKKSAEPVSVTNVCGSSGTPNSVYGHGVMRIYEAYKLAKEMEAAGEL